MKSSLIDSKLSRKTTVINDLMYNSVSVEGEATVRRYYTSRCSVWRRVLTDAKKQCFVQDIFKTDMRRLFIRFTVISAIVLQSHCELVDRFSHEYDHATRSNIRYSRGRRHFDPEEDGFFNDFGFIKSQYIKDEDRTDLADIRNNIPGEPGVDYAAYLKIPRTTFSCNGRSQGYYADEEAGCQVFHVCDDDKISSFLCPVGSLFNQQLLICDWWSQVACSHSHEFYDRESRNNVVKIKSSSRQTGQEDSGRTTSGNKLEYRGIIQILPRILQTNKLDDGRMYNPDSTTINPTDEGDDSTTVKLVTLPDISTESSSFHENNHDEDLEFKTYRVNYRTHYYPETFFAQPT